MAQNSHNGSSTQLDRNEMFALGAAAGAIVAAAVSEYFERRKPQTPLEKAQARGAEVIEALSSTAKAGSKQARSYVDAASEYVQDTVMQTKKQAPKQRRKGQQPSFGLKEAAAAALSASAVAGLADKAREATSSVAERVIGDPHAVSGSITETVKEYANTARETIKDAQIADRARSAGVTTSAVLKDYGAVVAETVKDYAETARETLKDAHLGEKAKDYSAVVAETVKDYAETARETIKDVHLGEKAVAAGSVLAAYSTTAAATASKAAQQSAEKLSDSASHLAEVTSERAEELRMSARKTAKRTRRRATWGFRSLLIGLAVGLLAAPQSGERTREAITSFVESVLDVFMPDNRPSSI